MSHFDPSERTREVTVDEFGDWPNCPECGIEGREPALRSHLREEHGWPQERIAAEFGDHPYAERF